ncbi:hexose transporter, putative [Theileria equi strain WA]|uniref:Hexose transporter 1 n=1 Tax=Theileria equi strain WA TaxID=1537102 RepID=L1LGH8_THEEQ|nr:hexose transporter, putative [Theileria equi strain WA]EKX74355.1 hexose transporter, putative [Theileria equi strain WA]|eukprot:XP_004833807.1 hexose transporter, putative [Theileria equi strain WA]
MSKKTQPQLIVGMTIASLLALSFGFTTANLNICKDFMIVELEWCKGAETIECSKAAILGGIANGAIYAGAAGGSLLMGFIAKYGRRVNMTLISSLYIAGSTMIATAHCFNCLLIGRIACGVAIGLSGVVPMFISEICPSESRGAFGIIYPACITFGQFASCAFQLSHGYVLGAKSVYVTIPFLDKFLWRFCQMFPAFFSAIALVLLRVSFTMSTPHELVEKGKVEEAKVVIEKLHGPERVDEVYEEIDRNLEVAKATPNISFIQAVKNKTYRVAIMHGIILAIFQHLTGISILTSNTAKMFTVMLGRTYNAVVLSCSITLLNTLITIFQVPFLDKFGRRTFFLTSISIFTVFSTLPALSKLIDAKAAWSGWVSVAGTIGFIFGFALGMGGVFWVYIPEMYSPEYKNGAFSVTVFANWTTACLMLSTSDILLSWSEKFVYIMVFIFSVINLLHVYFFIKETKGLPIGKAYS